MATVAMAVVVAVLFAALSGCAPLSAVQGPAPADAPRRECERNGGYWATAPGFCRIGA
jgi:hypothetical protein